MRLKQAVWYTLTNEGGIMKKKSTEGCQKRVRHLLIPYCFGDPLDKEKVAMLIAHLRSCEWCRNDEEWWRERVEILRHHPVIHAYAKRVLKSFFRKKRRGMLYRKSWPLAAAAVILLILLKLLR